MNQSVTLECGGCGRLHNSPTGTMPAGWSLDSELEKPLCGDCSAAGAQRDLQIANDHVRCETAIPLLTAGRDIHNKVEEKFLYTGSMTDSRFKHFDALQQ